MSFIINPNHNNTFNFNPKLKVAVLASGKGSNFNALIESTHSYLKGVEISILIYNNKDCLAKDIASKYSIPAKYIDHRSYKSREEFDIVIANTLKSLDIEFVVLAGWMRLLSPKFISTFSNRIINIHPSILPSFKGINAITQALNAGILITGCTVHKVINEVDSGEIIAQAAVTIDRNETISTLERKIQQQEHKILPYALGITATLWRKKIKDNML